MTLKLILDENVIEFAAREQNENDGLDITCLSLISDIIKRCDNIYCTQELMDAYSRKLKELSVKVGGVQIIAKLLVIAKTCGKIKVRPPAPKLPNEEGIPDDDRYLVRLAVITGCTLVSADGRLQKRLEETKLIEKHGIKIKH